MWRDCVSLSIGFEAPFYSKLVEAVAITGRLKGWKGRRKGDGGGGGIVGGHRGRDERNTGEGVGKEREEKEGRDE